MMEISNETKAKVFAQYLGQNVISNSLSKSNGLLYKVSLKNSFGCFEDKDGHFHDFNVENLKLILKPLDKITDEDAIEVCKMYWNNNRNNNFDYSDTSKEHVRNRITFIKREWINYKEIPHYVAQYLQSKGYDLPNYLLNGKTLHESGLAIYE